MSLKTLAIANSSHHRDDPGTVAKIALRGRLVCQIKSGNLFWNSTPCSPLPLPISKTKPLLKGIFDKTSPIQILFL